MIPKIVLNLLVFYILDSTEVIGYMINEMYGKAKFLKEHRCQDLISKIFQMIRVQLESSQQTLPLGLIKVIQIDLGYIFFRHQSWVHSSALLELAVDFSTTEYNLASQQSYEIVEVCIELLQSYFPVEKDWNTERYDRDFLRHILIACVTADSDQSLRADIGFGSSLLQFLSSVAELSSKDDSTYIFSSELVHLMNEILTNLNEELKVTPWMIDLYRLRDLFEQERFQKKERMEFSRVSFFFSILEAVGWQGRSLKELSKLIPILNAAHISKLQNLQLLYEEQVGQQKILRLSHLGFDIIAGKLAHTLSANPPALNQLRRLPEPIQWRVFNKFKIDQLKAIANLDNITQWRPKTLKVILERLVSMDKNCALDLLPRLTHNTLNSWAKSEVCSALANFPSSELVEPYLKAMVQDDSKRVRDMARRSLSIWRYQHQGVSK